LEVHTQMFGTTSKLVAGIMIVLIFGFSHVRADAARRNALDLTHDCDAAAAVAFDGRTETVILTTKMTSDTVQDLAWVISVGSDKKPVVERVMIHAHRTWP
jgi:hypothetical protein